MVLIFLGAQSRRLGVTIFFSYNIHSFNSSLSIIFSIFFLSLLCLIEVVASQPVPLVTCLINLSPLSSWQPELALKNCVAPLLTVFKWGAQDRAPLFTSLDKADISHLISCLPGHALPWSAQCCCWYLPFSFLALHLFICSVLCLEWAFCLANLASIRQLRSRKLAITFHNRLSSLPFSSHRDQSMQIIMAMILMYLAYIIY